ncbi:MAG: hypothetical protein NZ890_11370 [Myxococcota bacterium]|nr:hypothetical protein [Myxococcota bacterium]
MLNKGYDHPLYSLDLLGPGEAPPEDGRYAVPVPQGRLVVRGALRRRALTVRTEACERAVAIVLGHHATAPEAFAAYGLDQAWAGSMRHWLQRLWQEEATRQRLHLELHQLRRQRQAALQQAYDLWQRLRLSAELAGLGSQLVGRAPAAELPLLEALRGVHRRLQDPGLQGLLADHGFGPPWLAQLGRVLAWLEPTRQTLRELEARLRCQGDVIQVLRGALLGDVARLCRVAPLVLLPEQAQALTVRGLLGLQRRPASGAVAPDAPGATRGRPSRGSEGSNRCPAASGGQ